jgi:UDP-glucuronate 4-epimerase
VRFLVTGSAGFIGFHIADRLLAQGHQVTGLDGFTANYDVGLKRARHARLSRRAGFSACELLLQDADGLKAVVERSRPDILVHCTAQAGVRESVRRPKAFLDSNYIGTFNVLEAAKAANLHHLLLASSSSVYGANAKVPFRETDRTDHPLTPYAAAKKGVEALAHTYAHLWNIPTTALRFFTVYGPWGRPDMALPKFVRAILAREPIEVFGHGGMKRDFTYVEDLVDAVLGLAERPPVARQPVGDFDSLSPVAPFRTVNVGGGRPIALADWIGTIERCLGRKACWNGIDAPKGEPLATCAATDLLVRLVGSAPETPIETGVAAFIEWHCSYHHADLEQAVQ